MSSDAGNDALPIGVDDRGGETIEAVEPDSEHEIHLVGLSKASESPLPWLNSIDNFSDGEAILNESTFISSEHLILRTPPLPPPFFDTVVFSDANSNVSLGSDLPNTDGTGIAIKKTSDDEVISSLTPRSFVRMEGRGINRFPLILEASKSQPGLPANVTVIPDATGFQVSSDTPLDDGESLILNHQFHSPQEGENSWVNSFTLSTVIAHNAGVKGMTRHFRVHAGSTDVWLPWSNVVSGTGAPPPGEPTNLTALSGGPDRINLSWAASLDNGGADITGYFIEMSSPREPGFETVVENINSTETTCTDTDLEEDHQSVALVQSHLSY